MDDEASVASEVPGIVDLLSNSDGSFKLGEWEGNPEAFDKNFISQAALKEMRVKDKAENESSVAAQVKAQVDQHQAQQIAAQQAAAMQRATTPQQQPQGNSYQSGLDSIYAETDAQHQGYLHNDQFRRAIAHVTASVRAEFDARDARDKKLGAGLNDWHKQSQQRAATLETLQGTHVDGVWKREMDELVDEFPNMPRSMIEAMSSGFSGDASTPDQLRAGLRTMLTEQGNALNAHGEAARKAKSEQNQKLAAVGMPGGAAAAVPASPDKPLQDAGEIADHFFDEAGPAS